MPTLVVAAFLVAHGLIHASFVSPRPPATASGPAWPFDLTTSWILTPLGVGEGSLRLIGIALLILVVAGFVAAALATLGVAPSALFAPGIVVASVASIAMLAMFFNAWLVLGFAIDGLLLWATLANGWRPGALGIE